MKRRTSSELLNINPSRVQGKLLVLKGTRLGR
jgi:hypothetical protein